jgi:hypothetical protein
MMYAASIGLIVAATIAALASSVFYHMAIEAASAASGKGSVEARVGFVFMSLSIILAALGGKIWP